MLKSLRKLGLALALGLGLASACAPAFAFGPLLQQSITSANGVTQTTTATTYTLMTFNLSPGTWLCFGTVNFTPAGTTLNSGYYAFSTVAATLQTGQQSGYLATSGGAASTLPAGATPATIIEVPNSAGASKPIYVVTQASFTGTAPKAYGNVQCLKMN